MGSGCIAKWAGVGCVARGRSLFFYLHVLWRGRDVISFSFTYIIKY